MPDLPFLSAADFSELPHRIQYRYDNGRTEVSLLVALGSLGRESLPRIVTYPIFSSNIRLGGRDGWTKRELSLWLDEIEDGTDFNGIATNDKVGFVM